MNDIKANEFKIVKLLSFGQPKQGQYGQFYPECMVEVDGGTENWQIPDKKKAEIEKLEFKEGDSFRIERWYKDGKGGYNFKSVDSKNPYSQPSPQKQAVHSDQLTARIERAQFVNIAVACGMREPKKIVELAEQLRTSEVGNYINGL